MCSSGSAAPAPGKATTSLVVNSSNVILDDIWAWRADHGTGVGWTTNTADTGLIVNGDNVTAYGLFVEHYQKTEVIWNGQDGTRHLLPERDALRPAQPGRLELNTHVQRLSGLRGRPEGEDLPGLRHGQLQLLQPGRRRSTRRPHSWCRRPPGVQLHSLLTRFLNADGGIDSVVNGYGAPVTAANPGPTYIANYPVS